MSKSALMDKRRPRGRLDTASTRQPYPIADINAPRAEPPGGFSYGTSQFGGPLYVDAFGAKRAPSPWQLVEHFKTLIYAMTVRNANAVSRLQMRLYADGSRVQGRPRRACEAIRISRHAGQRLARAGLVSPAAVDQIYEIRNHPLIDVLDKPDPYGYFTRRQLIGLMTAYMDVVGGGMLVPEGRGWDWRNPDPDRKKGPPEFLWVVYAQYLTPFRDAGSNLVRYFQYFRDQLPFDECLWFRHAISLRDAYGSVFSPTYAGDTYASQEDRFGALWDQILALGPRPNVIASAKDPDAPPGESERRRLEQDFVRRQAAGNAGGLWVSTGAFDFNTISYAPADLAAKEVNEYNLYRLASIFGQPPTYYTVDTNISNLTAADEQHARNGVEPRCDVIAGKFTQLAKSCDPRLFFKFDPAIQEDDEARQRVIDMKLKSGQITINQANEEDRFPAVPWGDEPWMPGTLVQPSMAQEKHEQSIAAQQAGVESQRRRDEFELSDPEADGADDGGADDGDWQEPEEQERAVRDIVTRHWRTMDEVERRLAS